MEVERVFSTFRMATKKTTNSGTLASLLKTTAQIVSQSDQGQGTYIPSIEEFCDSPYYLGLPHRPSPIYLYPVQRLMLKAFYRGSLGNENLVLTPEDIELCKQYNLNGEKNGDVLGKWKSGELFNEFVLVWGRRSGKDFVISIIALYEAMKLIECPGGDPYKMYELGSAAPFTILTIAGSAQQATILFKEIRDKLMVAPYFAKRFYPEGVTQDRIFLLTPQNIKDNEELIQKGLKSAITMGSIEIRSGHSNSNTLVGLSCYCLLFDEVATFKTTAGASSGEQLYGNLSPTTSTYVRKVKKINPDTGLEEEKTIYDGKVISISSPRGMDGVFYNLYSNAKDVKNRLMCRLATWQVHPKHKEQDLRDREQTMTDEKFRMEYGAEFSGTEGENFFPPEIVKRCFGEPYDIEGKGPVTEPHPFSLRDYGEPGITYFAHLDPAISSHNYALVVVHKNVFLNRETKKIDFNLVMDHIRLWTPKEGKPIQIDEVDEYVVDLNRRFHLGLVTYDQWNSQSSIEKLRKAGIPAQKTMFNKGYKIQIYDEMYQLAATGKLKLPFHKTLRDEMFHLQRKFMAQGYRIYPKTEGEVRTDDCCDALAGACFNALKTDAVRLPQARLVHMGISPGSAGAQMWRSMQGTPYGYGSGQSVHDAMRRRSSGPWYK